MRKVIISGASGFLGKALTKNLLSKNIEVWAIVRNKNKIKNLEENINLKIIEAELEEYKFLDNIIKEKNFDGFFHFALEGGLSKNSFFDYNMQINNIRYSCEAFSLARRLNCKKFIFPGTAVQYEVRKYIEDGDTNLRIATLYGMSKIASEIFLKTLSNQYKDIELNIVYPAQIYGENDTSRTITRILIENLITGENTKLSTGNFLYDWVYIEDVIEAIIAVYEKGINGKGYYIGHRKVKKFKNIIEEVKEILNPNAILEFGAYPDSALIDYNKVDLDSLYKDTGFEIKSNFEDTIKRTAKWIKEDIKKDV